MKNATILLCGMMFCFLQIKAQNPIYNFSVNSATNMNLFRFDEITCSYTHVCYVPYTFGGLVPADITFTPDGKMYCIKAPSDIYELDTITGIQSFVCSYDWLLHVPFGPALETLNDSLLLTDLHDTLFALNIYSCTKTPLGIIGYEYLVAEGDYHFFSDGDMVWYKGFLYLVAKGKLFKIKLNESSFLIESSEVVNTSTEDIPLSYGLALYKNDTLDWGIVSFAAGRGEVLYIDPETGSFDTLCIDITSMDDPFYCNTFGSASFNSSMTNPEDTTRTSVNDFETGNEDFKIFPNPISDQGFYISSLKRELQNAQILVFDILGREIPIEVTQHNTSTWAIKLSDVSYGILLVEIKHKGKSSFKKIVR